MRARDRPKTFIMNADALEWRQARQWLINSGLIPATHRVTKPDVDLVDFARSLRDGVFLCSLLNTLKPDCILDWTPKPLMQVCIRHALLTLDGSISSGVSVTKWSVWSPVDAVRHFTLTYPRGGHSNKIVTQM